MARTTSSKGSGTRMRAEYDFSDGVRGKYFERYREGTNLVLLEPDVADAFPDAESVNRALRALVKVAAVHVTRPRKKAVGVTRRVAGAKVTSPRR